MTALPPQEDYTPHPRPERFDARQVPEGQLDAKLGIELIDYNPARVVGRMPVAGNLQPYGLLHGGASAAIAETVGSTAAALNAPDGMICVGTQVLANHHRATRSGYVTAVATPVHVGRSLSTFKIELFNDDGDLVVSGHLSAMTLPKPPGAPSTLIYWLGRAVRPTTTNPSPMRVDRWDGSGGGVGQGAAAGPADGEPG